MMKCREEYEKDLINHIRKDAAEVKDCFTRFSFHVITLTGIMLALIAKFQPGYPLVGLVSISVVMMALAIGRIGTYKYATANRLNGYELFLNRACRLRENQGWKTSYREIGWEEALRAWRTIQPTVFRYYYVYGNNRINRLKPEHKTNAYPWFEPRRLHVEGVAYHVGGYLRTMLFILFLIVGAGLTSLAAMVAQLFHETLYNQAIALSLVVVAIIVVSINKILQLSQRRKLLEHGILSIHSCSVMWQLVVVAHHRALLAIGGDENGTVDSLEDYTKELSRQAASIVDNFKAGGTPERWIYGATPNEPG